MEDRDFLMWLHERLEKEHGENTLCDYMHKLRAIIANTPKTQISKNCNTGNNLNQLRNYLEQTK